MTAAGVVVSPAAPADQRALAGLFQFYIYHFAGLRDAAAEDYAFGPDGLFEPFEHLGGYFTEPERSAHVVRVDGRLAGFVLMNRRSHCGVTIDHNIGEFFVAAQYRRGGVGAEVLRQMTVGRPGRWEAAIRASNTGAQAFWPTAIAALPGVSDITTTEGDGEAWTGPILHFTVPAA